MGMEYWIVLVAFVLAYVALIFLFKRIGYKAYVNVILISVTVLCYGALVFLIYRDVGFSDWNFKNALPTANVSPFMFASLVVYLFLPKVLKEKWGLLIALLSFGMLCALVLGCASRAVIHYKFHLTFLLDYFSHFALSLLGVYLVSSGQVEVKKKDCLLSGSLIVIVALIMLIVNLFAGTAFFGLALNENYNIYNMVLLPNPYLSALVYFVGLCGVLFLGYFYLKLVAEKKKE